MICMFSIDLVEEIIERQLKEIQKQIIESKQDAVGFSKMLIDEEMTEDDAIEITRVKHFAIKPMDAEEACVQMELLGHSFYVFRNAENR